MPQYQTPPSIVPEWSSYSAHSFFGPELTNISSEADALQFLKHLQYIANDGHDYFKTGHVHPAYIPNVDKRKPHRVFTSNLLYGLAKYKERYEDSLTIIIEVKPESNPTLSYLTSNGIINENMTWNTPRAVEELPEVKRFLKKTRKKLAKLLLSYQQNFPTRARFKAPIIPIHPKELDVASTESDSSESSNELNEHKAHPSTSSRKHTSHARSSTSSRMHTPNPRPTASFQTHTPNPRPTASFQTYTPGPRQHSYMASLQSPAHSPPAHSFSFSTPSFSTTSFSSSNPSSPTSSRNWRPPSAVSSPIKPLAQSLHSVTLDNTEPAASSLSSTTHSDSGHDVFSPVASQTPRTPQHMNSTDTSRRSGRSSTSQVQAQKAEFHSIAADIYRDPSAYDWLPDVSEGEDE